MFQKVSGQVIIAGMGEVLGIKFEAINMILELYQIYDSEERLTLFEKILAIDSVRLKFRSNELIKHQQTEKSKTKK